MSLPRCADPAAPLTPAPRPCRQRPKWLEWLEGPINKYGAAMLVARAGNGMLTLAVLCTAIKMGVDVTALREYFGIPEQFRACRRACLAPVLWVFALPDLLLTRPARRGHGGGHGRGWHFDNAHAAAAARGAALRRGLGPLPGQQQRGRGHRSALKVVSTLALTCPASRVREGAV